MKRPLVIALKLLGLGLVVFTIFALVESWQELKDLSLDNLYLIPLLFSLTLANLSAIGLMFDSVLRPHNIQLSPKESFSLAALTRFGNYVSFGQVGFAIRALYLKKRYKFDISKSISSIIVSNLLFYGVNGLVLLISAILVKADDTPKTILIVSGAAALVSVVLILSLSLKWLGKLAKSARLQKVLSDWQTSRNPRFLLQSIQWAVLTVATFSVMTLMEFSILGYSLGIYEALIITGVTSLNALFNLTPAGIGINEGLMLLAGRALGIPTEVIIAAAILRRLVVFTTVSAVTLLTSKPMLGLDLRQLISLKPSQK